MKERTKKFSLQDLQRAAAGRSVDVKESVCRQPEQSPAPRLRKVVDNGSAVLTAEQAAWAADYTKEASRCWTPQGRFNPRRKE